MFEADANKSPDELLEEIRRAAIAGFNQKVPTLVVPPTAALLIRLSRDAEAAAQTNLAAANANLTMQKNLIRLTVAILVLTLLMLGFQIAQFLR